MKKFLFVAGCARSGTSALVQLLAGSPKVVLGMERFGHLVSPDNFSLTPEHFTKERFLRLEKEDTFYEDLYEFHKFDADLNDKLDTCEWIGDKRPDLYESYDQLFDTFPNAKLIFIYRDIIDVASSYHGRIKEGKNWPASKNFQSAVKEWNRSLFLTREAINKGYDIHVVDYNTIFCSNTDLSPLFKILDIDIDNELSEHIKNIRDRSNTLATKRKILISDDEIEYINANAKSFLINDLKNKVFK